MGGGSRPPSLGLDRRKLKIQRAHAAGSSANVPATLAPSGSRPILATGRYASKGDLTSRRDGNAAARARNFMEHKFHVSMSHQEQIRADIFSANILDETRKRHAPRDSFELRPGAIDENKESQEADGAEAAVDEAQANVQTFEELTINKLRPLDWLLGAGIIGVGLAIILTFCFWTPRQGRHDLHSMHMLKYNSHITSPLHSITVHAPLDIELASEPRRLFDLKLVLPCLDAAAGCAGGGGGHRRRLSRRQLHTAMGRLLAEPPPQRSRSHTEGRTSEGRTSEGRTGAVGEEALGAAGVPGRALPRDSDMHPLAGGAAPLDGHSAFTTPLVEWTLWEGVPGAPGSRAFGNGSVPLERLEEAEDLETVAAPADLGADSRLFLRLRYNASAAGRQGGSIGAFVQVVQMGAIGEMRVLLGGLLFIFTFGLIISELINRVYATFVGGLLALLLLTLVYEQPELSRVVAMVDYNTMLLLFSMMINVHILGLTGFFQWISVLLAERANGNVHVIFFVLAMLTGLLSAFLDNVTCVMLIGPISISLCKQMGIKSVPFYLTQTIAATIGGAMTLIGDPPNVVIGSKLSEQISFVDFLVFNGPLVLVLLPVAVLTQFLRFKHTFPRKVALDLAKLKREGRIVDERALLAVSCWLGFVFLGLLLNPIHGQEPAWFCLVGMLGACLSVSRHRFRHFLEAVEWDTLLFFAALFVFVESLAELGLIRFVGQLLTDVIVTVPLENRLSVACLLVLWVSAIGSAFLESLPYTTTLTYILIDLKNEGTLGVRMEPLAWALSVGACVGGIGSIMGSSANLVALGVSARYSPSEPILSRHFLKYGLPLLFLLISIASVYQYVVFTVFEGFGRYPPLDNVR